MPEEMTKERAGFHNLFVQIPLVLWDRLCAEANEQDTSVARVLTGILQRHYKVSREELPRRGRVGRPPKKRS